MDINKLRYFLKICEETNISKAASGLFISQQGLSKSIISLENELKVPLFYRTAEGMILTKYGSAIKEYAEEIVSNEAKILETIDGLKNPEKQPLKVFFALGVLNSLPVDFIDQFTYNHPDIDFSYMEYPDNMCHQAVLDNEDCLGIVLGPTDDSTFSCELLKRHTPHAIVNNTHPLASRDSLSLEDLHQENVITINEDFQMYHNFLQACRTKGVSPNIVHTTGEIFVTYKMSSLDRGIGISVDFVSEDLSFSNVKSIPIICDIFTWDVTVIAKKDKALGWAGENFVKYLKSYYNSTE
ncbi:LysR family transcriptional regulator [Gudongella sp. SC589]|jgi:DNA-binding transcriptional LysR family regulator|uniref:LysR family transcriptional regulator n=1 Tax=Gudongella sp. SC589 TaxID=3385990 RepID=UPI0039048BED